jgi:2',3'-cyclic-nucleotide 2'-phosphodiesterase (5'-nucleotidase family)
LLLDSGDALIGDGILGNLTQGEAVVAGMNLMGYDAMAVGAKELSLGVDVLRRRMAEAEFPMLSANVVLAESGDLLAQPYAILEIAGRRVGILGLTRVPDEPVSGYHVLDPEQAARQYVSEIAEEVDTIVVLTNMYYRKAMAMADTLPGIDLIVTSLNSQLPSLAVRTPATGTIAVTAEQPLTKHTGRRVGRLVATLNSDGSLSGESWTSVSMDGTIADDLEMQVVLDRYRP